MTNNLTLADLGEDGLLSRIFPLLPAAASAQVGPGDDAAVVSAPDGRVVATTDVLVEGRDFRRDWSTGADVGWKAAAQNLADIAAMGAVPTALLVGLTAPASLPVSWALDLVTGLSQACVGTGAGVVGGDLSGGDQIVISVTALGDLQGRAPVLRSGARVGDVVAVAGFLGRSAAGLDLLRADRADLDPALVADHRRPRPPYSAGLAAATRATAMLDISDGLIRDLGRIVRASAHSDPDLQVILDPRALAAYADPLATVGQALGIQPLSWVVGGGEDHAIAATFSSQAPLPAEFTAIGRVGKAKSGPAVLLPNPLGEPIGWDHFKLD